MERSHCFEQDGQQLLYRRTAACSAPGYCLIRKALGWRERARVVTGVARVSFAAGQVRKTVEREVRVLRAVAHVNIVALLDVFRVAGRTHLVFEYVERTVLEALKVHPRGLGGLATRRIMWQLVKAIEYLHSQKVGFGPGAARCNRPRPVLMLCMQATLYSLFWR